MKLIKENCPTCTKVHAVIMLKKAGLQNNQPAATWLSKVVHVGKARAWIKSQAV